MERDDWGKMLFFAFCLAEGATGGFLGVGDSTVVIISLYSFLGLILPFVVGYLVSKLGLVYGLALGIAPAMYLIFEAPNGLFGLSPFASTALLLFASLFLSALSGLAGQGLALWRDAA